MSRPRRPSRPSGPSDAAPPPTPEVRRHESGATLRLTVRPGAQRSKLIGEHGGALKLAVAARPERGRANREVLRFLAEVLKLSRARLELISGEGSREKVVLCRGLDPAELHRRVRELLDR